MRLEGRLAAAGMGPGCCVAPICMEKSCWVPAAVLDVLLTGAALVTLRPSQPISYRQTVCRRSRASAVLTMPQNAFLAAPLDLPVDELLLEGPSLVQRYLDDLLRTAISFSRRSSLAARPVLQRVCT